ncbi:hypothetical protein HOLleu_21925 [Holothuria leucospilota]|uniref:Uncharacterized protein n=1 Tax=Holothuria leucospilota TaxID=206669 RepID=A0A9Q1H6T8_HOLLE|nr:hypothetical protein HOLleu_21925 [Holothuria leucospilota]
MASIGVGRGGTGGGGKAQEAVVLPVAKFSNFFGKHVVGIGLVGTIKCVIPTLAGGSARMICATGVQTSLRRVTAA